MKTRDIYKAFPNIPRADLNYLLCQIFSCNTAELPKFTCIDDSQLDIVHRWVGRLRKNEPPQYIVKKAWFYGLEFYVDSRVLIPRYDTEVLVHAVLRYLKGSESILEIGVGSGAISIALKHHFPQLEIVALDIDPQALQVAQINLRNHHMEAELIQADLFPEEIRNFDLIISNPPYISPGEYLKLDSMVSEYEPKHALLAENDGIFFYERILERAGKYLKDGGLLAFEHGCDQQLKLMSLTESAGFQILQKGKDLAMRDRFLIAAKI